MLTEFRGRPNVVHRRFTEFDGIGDAPYRADTFVNRHVDRHLTVDDLWVSKGFLVGIDTTVRDIRCGERGKPMLGLARRKNRRHLRN
ncbi:hypothetical protein D3C87_1766850 [compost metagenome]